MRGRATTVRKGAAPQQDHPPCPLRGLCPPPSRLPATRTAREANLYYPYRSTPRRVLARLRQDRRPHLSDRVLSTRALPMFRRNARSVAVRSALTAGFERDGEPIARRIDHRRREAEQSGS